MMPELPPLLKNYNLITHAIHSRMQLIRHRFDYNQEMTVNEFREKNKKHFENIKESIRINHDFSVNVAFEYNAAVMFLHSIDWEGENIKTLPEWKPKQKPDQP